MKVNLKVLIAAVLIVIVSVWAINSVRSLSYSGTDLSIATGHGAVTVTNPSEASVPVQLTGTGTRGFSVSSTFDGLSGTSVRTGTGRTATQLLELALPPGISSFTVVSSSVINFVANSTNRLDVTVQSLSETETRTTLIATGIVIVIALFYMSRAADHRLVRSLLRRTNAKTNVPAVPVMTDALIGKSQPMRAYGDNRVDISER